MGRRFCWASLQDAWARSEIRQTPGFRFGNDKSPRDQTRLPKFRPPNAAPEDPTNEHAARELPRPKQTPQNIPDSNTPPPHSHSNSAAPRLIVFGPNFLFMWSSPASRIKISSAFCVERSPSDRFRRLSLLCRGGSPRESDVRRPESILIKRGEFVSAKHHSCQT